MRVLVRVCLLLAVSQIQWGCGGNKPTIRDLLSFDESVVTKYNKDRAKGVSPDPAMCGDTKYAFLAELQQPGRTSNPKVPYEWAPVVPGPITNAPTVRTPLFYAAGFVGKWDPGKLDIRFSHPFGWRDFSVDTTVDQSIDVWLDNVYLGLNYVPPGAGNNWPFHVELEAGAWPVADFGFTPQPGDRTAMIGNWIMDCGHPENWGAE